MFDFKMPAELKSTANGSGAWLVDRLIPRDCCSLIAGAPKTRKSWFVYELIVSVATGTRAFGMLESDKGGVMAIQGEDSEGIIRERLNLIALTRGIHSDNLEQVRILAGQPFHLDDEEHFEFLRESVVRTKPLLLTLDPFIRLIPNTSENSSGGVSRILGKLRAIQRETGTTILLVHHFGKNGTPRGSSDFHGWLDAGFYLTKPSEQLTQVRLEYKGFKEQPDFLFKLERSRGGTAPVGISYSPNADEKIS